MLQDEELAQRLGVFPALAEDLVGFNPQHQHGISPLPLTPVPGGSNALFWPRRAPGIPEVHTHSGGHSHIHVKKKNKNSNATSTERNKERSICLSKA